MNRTIRGTRVVLVGILLGLLVSFIAVSRAQVNGEPMPLVTALQASALAADVQLVVAGVPVADVFLPPAAGDWLAVLFGLAEAHGLTVCEITPGTYLVSGAVGAERVCGREQVGDASAALAPAEDAAPVVEEPEPVADELPDVGLVYRVRVLQLDETRAVDLGLDWSGGVFETAARLLGAGAAVANGVFPSGLLGDIVRFLESEGVAMRLEDVELRSRTGESVRFNRGGTVSVNLVGGGGATIQDRYTYGLGVDLDAVVVDAATVDLSYVFTDSAPSNISDPANVQLASTSSSSTVRVGCGESVVLAAIGTKREGLQGSGLPGASAVPVVGYVAGVGGYVAGRTSWVVTVGVGCVR